MRCLVALLLQEPAVHAVVMLAWSAAYCASLHGSRVHADFIRC